MCACVSSVCVLPSQGSESSVLSRSLKSVCVVMSSSVLVLLEVSNFIYGVLFETFGICHGDFCEVQCFLYLI